MAERKQERRKFKRYNTEVKIYFDFKYDLQTKVDFEVIDKEKKKPLSDKYTAISRNISVEGLCIVSERELKDDDVLHLELYLPGSINPIHMEGAVRWCSPNKSVDQVKDKDDKVKYLSGILLSLVEGESVQDSIYYDQEYKVNWSDVLESVFGDYKLLMGGKYRKDSK
jgi:hypothetical protein